MRIQVVRLLCVGLLSLPMLGCSDSSDNSRGDIVVSAPSETSVFAVANGCFAISPDGRSEFYRDKPV